jgi:hypothetical protein
MTNDEKIQYAYMLVYTQLEESELDFAEMLSDDDIDAPLELSFILQLARDKIEKAMRNYD